METATYIKKFDLTKVPPPIFYRDLHEVRERGGTFPYTHLMRRAWEEMSLDGIYCVDGKPAVYFKEVGQLNRNKARRWHKLLWNQGLASVLVICSKNDVHVYSGIVPPPGEQEDIDSNHRKLEILFKETADYLEFIPSVETGLLYTSNPKSFISENTVDGSLLECLGKARDMLTEGPNGLSKKNAHSLLGRIIFTCYLTDRNIINGRQYKDAGSAKAENLHDILHSHGPQQAIAILNKLFDILQGYFNGSMFEKERVKLNKEHILILKRFLNVEYPSSKQLPLFPWHYDFRIIPVETISAIYEDFLKAENEEGQRKAGAYYTPSHLAEMVVDTAVEGWDSLTDKKVLDPSCGSGIFLVILFNRMAEEWNKKNPRARNISRANALKDILLTRIRGVDIHVTACRVACFSLYLAFLDHLNPRDIHEYHEKYGNVLPPLLQENHDEERRNERAVFEGNFFDPNLPLEKDFDLVIGNPPWVGRGQKEDPKALQWLLSERNPFLEKAPDFRKDRVSVFMPQKQTAHAFMWKTPIHLGERGRACLLLPSKVLLNRTDVFQKEWFSRFQVDKVLMLSDMSFILFKNAICPAVIIRFNGVEPKKGSQMEYIVPKANRNNPQRGVVSVEVEDRKTILQSEVTGHAAKKLAPVLWKKNFWGTPRDIRLLDRLREFAPLEDIVGTPKKPKRWIRGQGFQPFLKDRYEKNPEKYGEPKTAFWSPEWLYVNASPSNVFNLVLSDSNLRKIGQEYNTLRRLPSPKIFNPPMIITNQGFSRIAFSDFQVLFQDSLQSIAGPPRDANLLMFLAATLRSKIGTWFLFHTSANWGTERDKVHLHELMRFPFPLPETVDNPKKALSLVDEVARAVKNLKKKLKGQFLDKERLIEETRDEVEPLIYEYYDITEREAALIRDTVQVLEPSSTPTASYANIPTLQPTNRENRQTYADLLTHVLNQWARHGRYKVSASCVVSNKIGAGILTLSKGTGFSEYQETHSSEELNRVLKRLSRFLKSSKGRFEYLRGFKLFEGDRIHIIKPLNLRNWTESAALNDTDEIATAILSGGRSS